MKNVLLQIKNLNIVAEHYKYSSINKIRAASTVEIDITFLFFIYKVVELIISLFK